VVRELKIKTMIVTVQYDCIFNNEGQLLNYSRCVLSALNDMGYSISVYSDQNDVRDVENTLKMQMIPFASVNSLPIEENDGITYNGIVRISNHEYFNWLSVREQLKIILLVDYPSFYKLYCAHVMNEPYFHSEEKGRIINEMSQS